MTFVPLGLSVSSQSIHCASPGSKTMSSKSLSEARAGDSCLVLDVDPQQGELRDRLFSLGVIPGSCIQVLRLAPLGDPMQLRVGASFISIRHREAAVVTVEVQ